MQFSLAIDEKKPCPLTLVVLIMTILYLMPLTFSILLLTLHFFRGDNLPAMLLSLLLFIVLFIRRPWAARTLQVCLLLGSVEWIRTAISIAIARSDAGELFMRLVTILGCVSLFTVCSLFTLKTSRIRSYFKLVRHTPG